MAGGAGGTEAVPVWVLVAGGARVERQRLVLRHRLASGVMSQTQTLRFVALGTRDVRVPPGEREAGLRVIEARSRLPRRLVVAARAIASELLPVRIVVAAGARGLEAEPAVRRILALRQRHRSGALQLRLMAGGALQAPMRTLERPAGGAVIERPRRLAGPCDQREVAPAMVRMALDARLLMARVGTSPLTFHPGDLFVTAETLCLHGLPPAGLGVAAKTLRGPVELGMRPGQWPRRHLGRGHPGSEQQQQPRQAERRGPRRHPALAPAAVGTGTSLVTMRTPIRSRNGYGASPPMRTITASFGSMRC